VASAYHRRPCVATPERLDKASEQLRSPLWWIGAEVGTLFGRERTFPDPPITVKHARSSGSSTAMNAYALACKTIEAAC
jgi:hypothetical protein